MSRVTKVLLAAAGLALIGLGTLGMFVPVLPTTPLFLLALYCFARSSERLHTWFVGTRMYERYLANYVKTGALTMRAKLTVLIPVTAMMVVTAVLIDIVWVRVLLALLGAGMHFCFFFVIKTAPRTAAGDDE